MEKTLDKIPIIGYNRGMDQNEINAKRRDWYQRHLVYQRARMVKWTAYWRKKNRPKYMLQTAKARAKKMGFEFNLDISDIVIPEFCPYLKTKILEAPGAWKKGWDYTSSIDRIDSSKGYIKGNVEVISVKANHMKSNATKDELVEFAKTILKRHT